MKRIMKFRTPFHKHITIISLSMMLGMIIMSICSAIYESHMHGVTFGQADLFKLISLEQVKEVTTFIESIIVTVAQTVLEFLRTYLKG